MNKQPIKTKTKMTDKPVKVNQEVTLPRKWHFTKTALHIHSSITLDELVDLGSRLKKARGAMLWWCGDFMNFAHANGVKLGSWEVRQFLESFYAEGTLHNAAYVARRIERSRRRENLSYSHHQTVASRSVDEQEFWFDRTEEKNYSVKVLRMLVSRIKNEEERKNMKDDTKHMYVSDWDKAKLRTYEDYIALTTMFAQWLSKKINKLVYEKERYHTEFNKSDSYEELPQEMDLKESLKVLVEHMQRLHDIYKKYRPTQEVPRINE